jgi:CHAT domain-containing protein
MTLRILIFTTLLWIIHDSVYASKSDIRNSDVSSYMEVSYQDSIKSQMQDQADNSAPSDIIGSRISSLISVNNIDGLLSLASSLQKSIAEERLDSATLSEYYYYIGVCYLKSDKYNEAIENLNSSVSLKKMLRLTDEPYLKAIYNIGVSYYMLGDYIQVCNYMLDYINEGSEFYGQDHPEVAEAYITLIGATVECKDFENFPDYSAQILGILSNNRETVTGDNLIRLYINIGVGYIMMADYSKARIYLEQSESLILSSGAKPDANYINLINSLAVTYRNLGLAEKEEEYYNKGIRLALSESSFLGLNMVNSYAISLGNSGKTDKGAELLSEMVTRAEAAYGTGSRYYIEVLANYADYLLLYKKDLKNSLEIYDRCEDYLNNNPKDANLRDPVLLGYAQALFNYGKPQEALGKLQTLLFAGRDVTRNDFLINPSPDIIPANQAFLNTLRLKYEILWDLYKKSNDEKILEAAAGTAELIINVIDRIRINISEEESRIVLGARYRNSYLMAIRDFELCYRNTGEHGYLEKAFEYLERSKVAGLLAATRELNAIQLNIPAVLAEQEKSLQREIGFYNARIVAENEKSQPDNDLISQWNENLLKAVTARDSLAMTFRKDFPGYFTMKYDTKTPGLKEIPRLIGRNNNYLNYIISDSSLYIFIVNRKYKELLYFRTDSLFRSRLIDFQNLLSSSVRSSDARSDFEKYIDTGYELYKLLIDPVRKYFISDNLLISPDNILSYLPFETILTEKYEGDDILYRKLNYLMNDYNISYTYSATFMREMVNRSYSRKHELVAFAPVYTRAINLDSLMQARQSRFRILYDLPYARQEAQYVSGLTGGQLYLNKDARESVFKNVAGKFDIIHLAMHTFLNDVNPMNSAMIFMQDQDDKDEDGLLYTYEVYGIPLKARMVVLSSCNTGSGKLSEGEGILSLARGFLYSGSQSVVMSMWEIDDKSGTDIIKSFYDNLKKGKSKSAALKKARSAYLKKASQLKSHPYFWSSMVVYGDNSPLFLAYGKIILCLSAFAIALGCICYFWYRRNS